MARKIRSNKLLSAHPASHKKQFSMKTDELFRAAVNGLMNELDYTNPSEVIFDAVYRMTEATFKPHNPLPSRLRVDELRDAETRLLLSGQQALVQAVRGHH